MELLLTDTGDGGELELNGGDLTACDDFYSAMYLSLFGGNAYYNVFEDFETTDEFEKSLNLPISKQNLQAVEQAGKNALKWLIELSIVDEIEIRAYGNDSGKINVDISINQPDNANCLYGIIWDNQKAKLIKK